MWMNTFSRVGRAALQRSTSAMACQALRVCRRPGPAVAPLPSCLASAQLRGQQTLGSASLPQSHSVRQVRLLDEERLVEVEWEDGGHSMYPFTWLRDNCQCPHCYLESAQARQLSMSDIDINTGIDALELTSDNKGIRDVSGGRFCFMIWKTVVRGDSPSHPNVTLSYTLSHIGQVSIVWPDQHTSVFDPEWLKKRCFSSSARQKLQEELFLNERYYWDSKLRIPTGDFEEVLRDDKAALAWLLALRRFGIAYLKGAPAEEGQVARLGKRIGYLRMTFYGHTFQVKDKFMANNVAYTPVRLSLHTDYPALHSAPGVQILHCINQAEEGGESEMVDGFHMADKLQREDPEAFRTLSTLRADFTDKGADYCDFSLQSKNFIIDVNKDGHIERIHCNNATRDTVLDLPLHQVQPFYRALKTFQDIMNRPENVLTFKMEKGDVVIFDNWRLLHGRRSYISRPDALRHLEGAYMDWDEVMSRLRLLRDSVGQV